ncbi:pilus assembly protein PilP [Leptospira sp. 96542]|nr:pilus assembly protein PilP [Leptospira sp. 96542]
MSLATPPRSSPQHRLRRLRGGLLVLITVLPALVLGSLVQRSEMRTLDQLRVQARQAGDDHRGRLAQSQALEDLRAHRQALSDALGFRQAGESSPAQTQAWSEALLRDIHRAAQRPGLRFELFRPGAPVTRPHHVELPFTLRVIGNYRDLHAFVANVAALAQVVTVDRLTLLARGGETGDAGSEATGLLALDVVARACRSLPAQAQATVATAPAPAPAPASVPALAEPAMPAPVVPAPAGWLAGGDPFDPRRLSGAPSAQPPMPARVDQPLEARPLSSLRMVGSLRRGEDVVALVQADLRIYQVPVGAVLGQHRARVLRISEDGITLRESVPVPGGPPLGRTLTMPLERP